MIEMKNKEEFMISFEFSLCYQNGELIDSNVDKEPMSFRTGVDEMLPTLEKVLIDLDVLEEKRVFLSADEAYGPVRNDLIRKFPLKSIPESARQIGRKVMAMAPDGSEEMVDVIDIRGDQIALNFNHPLAGKDLRFDVKIITKTNIEM